MKEVALSLLHRTFAILVLVLALMLTLLPGAPAAAQRPAGNIAWSAEALFGGLVKYGEWLPVRVTLSNRGGDRTVEVRAIVTSSGGEATFIQPLELPAGARKQVDLYVLPTSFSRRLPLTLTEEHKELAASAVDVQPITYHTLLIGLLARDPDALSILRTLSIPQRPGGVRTVALSTGEIPERPAGLRSFDVLILNAVDTSQLAPAQQQALSTWVQLGGHLVVGGGAGAALTTAGLPADLLPVTLDGTRSVDGLPGLTTLGGDPIRVPGPFVVAETSLAEESIALAEQDTTPLIVQRETGQGRVTFLALDLGLSPFGAWAGEKKMWSTLLQPDALAAVETPPDVSPHQLVDQRMMNALSNLPALDLPSVRWVVPLLAIYVFLVGPINYFVLRRARRPEWAWITIPAMTLTFSVGAYGVGYALRGGEVIVNKLSIIEPMMDVEVSSVRTYVGLFSPTKRTYTVSVAGDPLVRSLHPQYSPWSSSTAAIAGDITVIQGRPTKVRNLTVNQWAMQTFAAETVIRTPIALQSDLRYRDGRLKGQVTNASALPLQDTVIALADDFIRLGSLEAGQTVEVDFEVSTTGVHRGPPLSYLILQDELSNPGPRGPSREIRLKQQILDSVFLPAYETGYVANAGPLIIGWLDESPQSTRVEGTNARELATSLVIAQPALHFGEREVGVPPGFTLAQLVEQEGNASQCYGGRSLGFTPYQGAMVLEFRLPRDLHDVRFSELNLIIESDGGWGQAPATALYDWTAGGWQTIEDIRLGANHIDDPNPFIQPTNHTIRVRMQAGNQKGGCLYTNIALEGTRGSVLSDQ